MNLIEILNILNILKDKAYFEEDKNINIAQIIEDLKVISILNNINFDFFYSVLVDAMEKGEWVLLDDIQFAKAEIERLMSLLEEDPSLTIYESEESKIFRRNLRIKNKKKSIIIL